MKKIILSFSIVACCFVTFGTTNPVSWKKGNGTDKNPYVIESAEHFYYLAAQVNSGNDYENAYFILSNNIDLKREAWTPIGNISQPFKGNFNGNNFEVKNLYVESPALDYIGLFGCVFGGNIENTGISGLSSVKGKDYVGAMVGYQMGGSIYNCYNQASVNGQNNVGGIVGYQYGTTVKSCYNAGTISGKWHTGGINGIGYANTTIQNCYNIGDVNGDNYVGGIAGKMDGYNHKAILRNCYQKSIFNKVGIIGTGISIELTNCYFAEVDGMGKEKFGEVLPQDEMKTEPFLALLNEEQNIWLQDKKPNINSGYPILASMKYNDVFTNEATDIKEKTATLNGAFSLESEKILKKGFEYKAENSPQYTSINVDLESFTYDLTNLTPYTKYEFRAFVMTEKGKITGRKMEFRTHGEKCGASCGHIRH